MHIRKIFAVSSTSENILQGNMAEIYPSCDFSRKKWEYKEKQKTRIIIARSIEHVMEILNKLRERQKEGTIIEETVAGAEEQRDEAKESCMNIKEKLTKEENKLLEMEKEFEKEELLQN
ncbi:unnamed protein product, partial [Onchocerca flexuosa]|uniref:Uncharacterized protein n=1 Tax=Onchocerca flexuosa TaxID=387005 RepID=A0A183HPI1_9BILA